MKISIRKAILVGILSISSLGHTADEPEIEALKAHNAELLNIIQIYRDRIINYDLGQLQRDNGGTMLFTPIEDMSNENNRLLDEDSRKLEEISERVDTMQEQKREDDRRYEASQEQAQRDITDLRQEKTLIDETLNARITELSHQVQGQMQQLVEKDATRQTINGKLTEQHQASEANITAKMGNIFEAYDAKVKVSLVKHKLSVDKMNAKLNAKLLVMNNRISALLAKLGRE